MSKKPVPSKKQCPSSTASRHSKFKYNERTRISEATVLEKCKNCGNMKRRHEVCHECGTYNNRSILKQKTVSKPIREIKA